MLPLVAPSEPNRGAAALTAESRGASPGTSSSPTSEFLPDSSAGATVTCAPINTRDCEQARGRGGAHGEGGEGHQGQEDAELPEEQDDRLLQQRQGAAEPAAAAAAPPSHSPSSLPLSVFPRRVRTERKAGREAERRRGERQGAATAWSQAPSPAVPPAHSAARPCRKSTACSA